MSNPASPREQIEWCNIWIQDANVDGPLPRVLFIGDSITQGVYPEVESLLSGKAHCARVCTSRFLSDPVYFQELALVVGQYRFSVIHFNNGLHGWAFDESQYAAGLPVLVQFLRDRAPEARLIWAQSTMVRKAGTSGLDDARVIARNRLAAEAMSAAGIAVNDLHALTSSHPESLSPDNIHYQPEGYKLIAAQVAQMVCRHL